MEKNQVTPSENQIATDMQIAPWLIAFFCGFPFQFLKIIQFYPVFLLVAFVYWIFYSLRQSRKSALVFFYFKQSLNNIFTTIFLVGLSLVFFSYQSPLYLFKWNLSSGDWTIPATLILTVLLFLIHRLYLASFIAKAALAGKKLRYPLTIPFLR